MNLMKSALLLFLLATIGLFLAGCGCKSGECPFKKIFGGKSTCPAETTETTPK